MRLWPFHCSVGISQWQWPWSENCIIWRSTLDKHFLSRHLCQLWDDQACCQDPMKCLCPSWPWTLFSPAVYCSGRVFLPHNQHPCVSSPCLWAQSTPCITPWWALITYLKQRPSQHSIPRPSSSTAQFHSHSASQSHHTDLLRNAWANCSLGPLESGTGHSMPFSLISVPFFSQNFYSSF